MESAPQDGTWVVGRDKSGREAQICSRVTHPRIPDIRHWAEGDAERKGDWTVSKCFYPVEWRKIDWQRP